MTSSAQRFMDAEQLPLRGIKVLELSHMIMGPGPAWSWPTWAPT